MIERQKIDGRMATISSYGDLVKIVYDDGEVIFLDAGHKSTDAADVSDGNMQLSAPGR